eukprot:gene3838-2234_t
MKSPYITPPYIAISVPVYSEIYSKKGQQSRYRDFVVPSCCKWQ